MFARDKDYKKVEAITIGCYAAGLALACATRFIPFIFLTLLAYPISFKLVKDKPGRA